MYRKEEMALSTLWDMPINMADLNLAGWEPSVDGNGTDTETAVRRSTAIEEPDTHIAPEQ